MIDINAESYAEITLTNFRLKERLKVQQWIHCFITFSSEMLPQDIIDPEILVILNQDKQPLQIILQEEGCDSPNFQLTESEKSQVTEWLSQQDL
ncbi:hypothetical protein [Evansella tamaricis]|uniref:Uncharacterized protein n=1 Tax=Evansella tamaricis TaxID=2069301 RepID=A0ABS6JG88_9BACI|nr:hypothetical protein [Evansella tamaricis]MBU9712679.1 hypothetical protein [Evansella tamaricis]